MKKYESLLEMTEQKSGIIIYDSTKDVMVCNWRNFDGGLPCLDPMGIFLLTINNDPIEVVSKKEVDDIADALAKMESGIIIYDVYDEIEMLFDAKEKTSGTVYQVVCGGNKATVIAPEDWD